MGPVVEKLILFILGRILTPEVKKEFIDFLRAKAAQSNPKLDDVLVDVLAMLMGVP
jgi:hypothetical protein